MFVERAIVLGEGDIDVKLFLIREDDGRYRRATGADLSWLNEHAPKFVRLIRNLPDWS